jgi:hypothetical protein
MRLKQDENYVRDLRRLTILFQMWVETKSRERYVDLRFYDWRGTVFAAPLQGDALDLLCASSDAREMCEWADAQSGNVCTLLQALAAAESLGLKHRNDGPPVPAAVLSRFQLVAVSSPGGDA